MIHNFCQWFLHITGADNPSGPEYGFWSGFGSDIGEFAIAGALWRKLNCHVRGCPRVGLHKVDGTSYVTCRKHHPRLGGSRAATSEQIASEHREASE